jgi:membrane protein implicated in regulation of membrane protease activity
MSPTLRLLISAVVLSTWLVLLFSGWAFGGAVYLLLAVALVVFPWTSLRTFLRSSSPEEN